MSKSGCETDMRSLTMTYRAGKRITEVRLPSVVANKPVTLWQMHLQQPELPQ